MSGHFSFTKHLDIFFLKNRNVITFNKMHPIKIKIIKNLLYIINKLSHDQITLKDLVVNTEFKKTGWTKLVFF